MGKNNCYCGLVAHANCIRCGSGVCYLHFGYEHHDLKARPPWSDYSFGETLKEAAYLEGYSAASHDAYTCKACRRQDGVRNAQKILRISRSWPQNPLVFAMSAACEGYVTNSFGMSFDELLDWWLKLQDPAPIERVGVTRVVRKAWTRQVSLGVRKVVRPAKHKTTHYQGWSFPGTAPARETGSFDPFTSSPYVKAGPTILRLDGVVFQYDEGVRRPAQGNVVHLMVEMARKITISKGHAAAWKGPREMW